MHTPPPVKALWRTLASAVFAVFALAAPARADLDLEAVKPDGFARGVAFTVNGYAGSETLADFPVLVRISEAIDGFRYDDLMFPGTGDDIAFVAADGTPLAYDIDTWNPAGESLVWVTLPSMEKGTQFALFYRSSKSGKDLNAKNAFSDYVGVWHMGETGDGVQNIRDATDNALLATSSDSSRETPDGMVGGARMVVDFRDKADKAIKVTKTAASTAALATLGENFVYSAWYRPFGKINNDNGSAVLNKNAGIGYDVLFARKIDKSTRSWGIQLMDNPNSLRVYTSQNNEPSATGAKLDFKQGEWAKIDVVYDSTVVANMTHVSIYWNGKRVYGPAQYDLVQQGDTTLVIGGYDGKGERPFYGDVDEVRVAPFLPTVDWIVADYSQVTDAAFVSASEVASFAELPKPVGAFSLVDSGAAFAQFSGSLSSLGGDATAAEVFVRVYPAGADAEAAAWTTLATGLAAGGSFDGFVTGLVPETDYAYEIKAINDLETPYESDVATGSFTTSGAGGSGTGGDAKRDQDSIVHTFVIDPESGDTWTFTPPAYATSVEALVVAGGGAGGYYAGGGGGGGGLVYDEAFPVTGGATYTIKVGAGGVASAAVTSYGSNGGDSSISLESEVLVTAIGGGAGGNGSLNNQTATRPGVAGGSGGGSSADPQTYVYSGGAATQAGQGNAGGTGLFYENKSYGGGGGGAGGAGGNVSSGNTIPAGSGGIGRAFSISGTETYYAGGGGGGGAWNTLKDAYGSPGDGGNGGGGKGGMASNVADSEISTAGEDGRGGGGGGGSTATGYYAGQNGGSGVVIIRYPIQGDGTTEPAPAVALTSAAYDAETGKVSFAYRVAWAGYGYQLADVGVAWGYSPSALTTTNIVATGKIGSGSGEITLPQVSRTVYLRAVAVNAAGLAATSVEQAAFTLFNPNAPVGTISLSSAAVTSATLNVTVDDFGTGAESATVTVEVCDAEDFAGTVLSFQADETLTELGTVSVEVNGLSPNSTYYARAFVVNDDGVELTTDPVEFATYAPGAPVATARTGDIVFTTLEAIVRVSDFGAYASSASARLEVSTTEDFAMLVAVSDEEAIPLNSDLTLSVSGLAIDTYYYRRVRVRNDWGVDLYVALPYTSTRAVPFEASGPAWTAGSGTVDLSVSVSAVYDGAELTAVLTYGDEEIGSQTITAAGPITWNSVPAKADGTVASVVVTASLDGAEYSRTFSAPVTLGARSTVVTSVTAHATYGDNALWLRPGDVAMLPDLYGEASYEVLNERFATLSGSMLTALEPGIVGIRAVDASFTTNIMGVVVLPDPIGSGSVYVFKESKRNNTYDWARPECWDKVVFSDGAATRAASNDSFPQNADDIAILPFYAASGNLYIRHRSDITVGGLYSGMIRPDTLANCVLERYKEDTTKTVTFKRTDGEPVQILVCPNGHVNGAYSRIRLGSYAINVVWASDAVIDCGSSETDWDAGLRGYFDVKDTSPVSTVTLQDAKLVFKGYPGFYVIGSSSTVALNGFWKGTGTLVKEGMGGIVFNNDIGGLSGEIVLKGQKTPGGLVAPATQFSIRGGGATNLAATVYGVVNINTSNGSPTTTSGAGLFGTSAQVGAAPAITAEASTYDGKSGARGPDAPGKGVTLAGASWYVGRIDNTTWGVDAKDDKVLDCLRIGTGMSFIWLQNRNNNTSGYPINVLTAKELQQSERGTLAITDGSRQSQPTAVPAEMFYAKNWAEHAIGAEGDCVTGSVYPVIPWIISGMNGDWGNTAFASFDEEGRLVYATRDNVQITQVASEDANLYFTSKNLNYGEAGGDYTINSLFISNSSNNRWLGADRTLRIKSGGVILQGASAIGLPGREDNGRLVLGDETHPAYVWAKAYGDNWNYIGAAVSAPGGFVSAYFGNLALVGDQRGIADEIAVNAGTLSIGTAEAECTLAKNLPIRVAAGATLLLPAKDQALAANRIKLDSFGKEFAKVLLPVSQKCASLSVRDVSESAEWTELPAGTYGSSVSGAEYVDDDRFAGPGVLRVGTAAPTIICIW